MFPDFIRISGNECKVVAYGLAFGLGIKPMLLKVNVVKCFLQLCYLIQYGINMLCRYSQKSSVSERRKEGRLFRSHRLWHADRGKHSEQHVYQNQECFMIRRLVGETKLVKPFLVCHKLEHCSAPAVKVMNTFARRSRHLIISTTIKK